MTGLLDFVVEQKDDAGKWHAIWSKEMLATMWFTSRYGGAFDKNRNDTVHRTLRKLNVHGHNVQDALFAKHDFNQLSKNGFGTEKGIATAGYPQNMSACLSHLITHSPESTSKECAYTLALVDILDIDQRLGDIVPENIVANEQKRCLQIWAKDALKAIHFIQTDFLNQIIGRIPQGYDAEDPDFELHTSNSAHETLAIANGGKWDTLCKDPDATRIVFY